jgi:GTP-binding protein
MARVSRTPGRTREINFFNINDQFVLADLPGYGYAKASETTRREMRYLVDRYLRGSRALRGLVVLMDVRRVPSKDDERMLDLVAELEIPVLIAVTKVDKLSATRAREHAKRIREHLQLEDDQIVPFSAVTGAGRDELAAAVMQIVTGPPRTLTQ